MRQAITTVKNSRPSGKSHKQQARMASTLGGSKRFRNLASHSSNVIEWVLNLRALRLERVTERQLPEPKPASEEQLKPLPKRQLPARQYITVYIAEDRQR